MPSIIHKGSELVLGRRWDDGFIHQRLLGLGVASTLVGVLLGIRHLAVLISGS